MCYVSIAISHCSFRALRAPTFAAVPESCRIVRALCRPRYATSYPVAMCTQAMEQIRVDSLSIGRPTGLDPDPVILHKLGPNGARFKPNLDGIAEYPSIFFDRC